MNNDDVTLRDFFAAAALTGLLANPSYSELWAEKAMSVEELAYTIADNMLAEGDDDDLVEGA